MNSGETEYPQKSMRQQVLKDKELQKIFCQADQPIVSMKQGNACGEKGLAKTQWERRDTSTIHRDGQWVLTKLISITQRAKREPKCRFTALIHLLTEGFLRDCFAELKKDRSAGIDGVTVEEYEANLDERLKELVSRMKAWKYRPQPVRRVYIPKPNGTKRALGIPTIEDKIVQMGIKKILEAIYEVDFKDVSFGFRPNRNCHTALNMLDKTIMTKPINYIVDIDIENFFDTIDHKWLMRCLKLRIADPNLLRLIGRFLNAGVIEEGKHIQIDKGTPQGGVLSPILANIYLHYILDLWFEKSVKTNLKGFAQLARYADDFIVCFQSKTEAEAFKDSLKQRLDKFGLKIAQDKTRVIEFGRYVWQKAQQNGNKVATFDFLGFTHYCDKTRKGSFKLGRKTSSSKFRQKMKAMNTWLKDVRNLVKLQDWWQVLSQKLIGHYNYYGISGNMPQLNSFYKRTLRLAYKWINRRSQKRSYNLAQYYRFLKYNPLPLPKIYHSMYTLSSF